MTAIRDIALRLPHDILSGFALLTRLPLPDHRSTGAASAWAWPLVGAALGAAAAALASAALWLGVTPGVTAVLVLAFGAMLTGGLHEDGLSDTADGLFGGWTKARRLEIMKDSRVGSYGVLALVLVVLALFAVATHVPLLRPNLGMAYYNLGNRYKDRGEWELAIAQYEQELERDASYLPLNNNLALVYEKSGRHRPEAILAWERVLRIATQKNYSVYAERARRHLRDLGAVREPPADTGSGSVR